MPNKIKQMFEVDLQMFNDGGASGGAEGSTATATENAPKTDVKPSGSSRRSKTGEFDNVVFGKQEGTTSEEATSLDTEGNPTGAGNTDVTTTSDTLEARRKAYDDFINKNKDFYQEDFQKAFNRRFKEVKGIEAELAEYKELADMFRGKYGTDDIKQLKNALREDTEYWEAVAEEKGMTVEQYHAMQKLERENAELRAIRQRQIGQQQFQQQIDTWYKEADRVKEIYPSFDFKKEAQNPEFLSLLRNGNTVEHAYKVLHFDELTQNAARVAAQTADAQAQARIKQKASRPSENGTSSQSAAIVRSDVSTLTRKERAEIARRVQRGETIKF